MKQIILNFIVVLTTSFFFSCGSQPEEKSLEEIPELKTRVTDNVGVLSKSEISELTNKLKNIESATGAQVAVLIVKTTGEEAIEQFSIRVVEEWKLGQEDPDNGVLILAAMDDKQVRIEPGHGLEGVLTDAYCKRLITSIIIPNFRNGAYYAGLSEVVSYVSVAILGEAGIEQEVTGDEYEAYNPQGGRYNDGKLSLGQTMLLFIFPLMIVVGRLLKKKAYKFGLLGAIVLVMFLVTSSTVLTGVVAFFMGIGIFSSGNSGRGGGGIYYGGGFGGGGFSGGGFGGGFSGGGGSFGGGGASGGW